MVDDDPPFSSIIDPENKESPFSTAEPGTVPDPATLANPQVEGTLIPELSTERSNSYKMPDGSVTVAGSLEPVNYQDEAGAWVPIDNTLVPALGAAFEVKNAEADVAVKIPADAGSTPVKVSLDGFWVTMKLHGLDGAPEVEGDTATFDQVPNADAVELQATNTGLKESILLNDPPAGTGAVTYTYDITASAGVTPELVGNFGVQFLDDAGEVKATIPIGSMWDSAFPAAMTDTGQYELAASGPGWTLTMRPDATWLRDPARVYPVVIDPTIGVYPNYDCKLKSDFPWQSWCGNQNDRVLVGRESSSKKFRHLLDFGISVEPGSRLNAAALSLIQRGGETIGVSNYAAYTPGYAFNNLATWNSSGGTAWTGGSPTAPNSPALTIGPSSGPVQRVFDVTSIVNRPGNPGGC